MTDVVKQQSRLKDLIAKGKNSAVALNRPVPVHLT